MVEDLVSSQQHLTLLLLIRQLATALLRLRYFGSTSYFKSRLHSLILNLILCESVRLLSKCQLVGVNFVEGANEKLHLSH
jgi:hypothetical protein